MRVIGPVLARPPPHRNVSKCMSTQGNGTAVRVRRGKQSDIRAVSQVVSRAFSDDDSLIQAMNKTRFGKTRLAKYVKDVFAGMSYMEVARQFSRRLGKENERHVVLVAECDDTIIGCVEMGLVNVPRLLARGIFDEIEQWDANIRGEIVEGKPYIGNLAVKSEYRRKGVASQLVREAQRWADEEWESEWVCLHVDSRNEAAKRLYGGLGFTCEVREPEFYPAIGRIQRLFLRGERDAGTERNWEQQWQKARIVGSKGMNAVEYVRWCVYDLAQTRRKRQAMSDEV